MKDEKFFSLVLEKAFRDMPALNKKEFRSHFRLEKDTANALFDLISTTPFVEKKKGPHSRIRLKNPFAQI